MNLLKIDCSTINSHRELTADDHCLYWTDYTSGESYSYSTTNQLIFNLKKGKNLEGTEQYNYKNQAIQNCASFFMGFDWSPFSIIPIPPSKGRNDPLYDDRLLKILNAANAMLKPEFRFDCQDIIIQNDSYEASHNISNRPDSNEIMKRYTVLDIKSHQLKNTIFLFDDMLTHGSHFKAAQSLLSKEFPDKEIYGLFIARRIYRPITNDNFEEIDF